jgi:hypothetical protein
MIDQDDLETWLVSLIPGDPFDLEREIYHLIQKRVKKQIGNRLSRDLEVMLFRLLRGELLEARQRVKLLRLITSSGGSSGNYTVALYAALLLDRSVK